MTIRHHPADPTLVASAAGTLGEGLSVVLATHLALCGHCRERMRAAEALGGALFEALPAAPPSAARRDAILARLDRGPGAAPGPVAARDVPRPLADYLDRDLAAVPWRGLARGVRHYPLSLSRPAGGTLRLFRIAPGTALPRHTHAGQEFTLVLDGAFHDETGEYRSGDLADMDATHDHRPIADEGGDCVCLVATDAPLRFHGLVPRLVQPFLGL